MFFTWLFLNLRSHINKINYNQEMKFLLVGFFNLVTVHFRKWKITEKHEEK